MSYSKISKEEKIIAKLQEEKATLVSVPQATDKVNEVDKKLASAMTKLNKTKFDKEIENLLNTKKSKGISAAIHKLKESVMGPKEEKTKAMVIEDPEMVISSQTQKQLNRHH